MNSRIDFTYKENLGMNLKRRIESLEKLCGLSGDMPPALILHFADKDEEITPADQIEIDKEIARKRAENPNSPFPVLVYWPPTHPDHPNNWKEVDPDLTR